MGAVNSVDDTNRYLDGYPGLVDAEPPLRDNLAFYQNQLASQPAPRATIEEMLEKWWGNYRLLEVHHGYIQWLFPIRERGLNPDAHPLQLGEIAEMVVDPVVMDRVLRAYAMFLDFLGMQLVDGTGPRVERAHNWRHRYAHLNSSFHNYLRITRMLKFLGEVGLTDHQAGFVHHVLDEIIVHGKLRKTHRSVTCFWSQVVRDETERATIAVRLNQICEEIGPPPGTALRLGQPRQAQPRLTDLSPATLLADGEHARARKGGTRTKVKKERPPAASVQVAAVPAVQGKGKGKADANANAKGKGKGKGKVKVKVARASTTTTPKASLATSASS